MRWSGRSASPARRWWDRAARRHARRGSKIPEDDRSFFFLYDFTHPAMGGRRMSNAVQSCRSKWLIRDGAIRLLGIRKDNRVRHVNRQDAAAVELLFETILLRGACHRAALCADPLVALSEKIFTSASYRVGLVFRSTIGRVGLATAEARPIEG